MVGDVSPINHTGLIELYSLSPEKVLYCDSPETFDILLMNRTSMIEAGLRSMLVQSKKTLKKSVENKSLNILEYPKLTLFFIYYSKYIINETKPTQADLEILRRIKLMRYTNDLTSEETIEILDCLENLLNHLHMEL